VLHDRGLTTIQRAGCVLGGGTATIAAVLDGSASASRIVFRMDDPATDDPAAHPAHAHA
jgi:hypothetical protein